MNKNELSWEKERELDIKELILYVWNHMAIAIALGIVMAILGGVYGYITQGKKETPEDTYHKMVTMNHDKTYAIDDVKIDAWSDRLDGTFIATGRIYVDFDFSNIEGNSNLDYTQMVSKLQGDLNNLFSNDEVRNDVVLSVNKKDFGDLNPISTSDLKWQISSYFSGANILQYSVMDVDSQRALEIAQILSDEFIQTASDYDTVDEIKVIDDPFIVIEEEAIVNIDKKTIIKYAFFGGVAGVFFVCVIYLALFIFTDAVRTSGDIDYLNQTLLGRIPRKGEKRYNEIKRVAYNLAVLEDKKNILFVPVDYKFDISEIINIVIEEIDKIDKKIQVKASEDITCMPDAIIMSKKSDGVILVARYGETSMKNIQYALTDIGRTNTDVLGVVIDGVIK